MNCPHHILVYSHDLHSYRDLPLRIAELGQNYRLEKSGELMGMVRVRSFTLNDAHIFCTPEQVIAEVRGAIELANYFMSVLGVTDYWYRLSVRDNVKTKWAGTDEEWETSEAMLKEALESLNLPYKVGWARPHFMGRRSTSRSRTRNAESSPTTRSRWTTSCPRSSSWNTSLKTGHGSFRSWCTEGRSALSSA